MLKIRESAMKYVSIYKGLSVQLRASLWFLICAFLQKGISVITTPIFTRMLSSDEYGAYSVFSSWISIVTAITTLNLHGGMYAQGLVKFEDDKRRFSASMQGLSFILVLVWGSIYLFFHDFFGSVMSLNTIQLMLMFVIIWGNGSYNFWAVSQRVEYRYQKLVILTLSISILRPILEIILIRTLDDNVTARILGAALIDLVVYGFLFISQLRSGKTFFSKKYWPYALKFNIPLVPHYLSQVILNNSDRIMIGKMVGESAAGIYSLAYNISLMMMLFNTSLLQTIEPWIFRKIKEREEKEISKVAYPSFVLVAAVNIVLIAMAPEVVSLFAPEEYYAAIWVIPPVAMSVYFNYMYSFFALFEFYFEKPNYITMATIVGAICNIILNYFFIDKYGYYAAGYTTLFCYILYAVMHYLFMRKVCKENLGYSSVYNIKTIILISSAFVVMGSILLLTYNYFILRYCFIALFFIVAVALRKKICKLVKQFMKLRGTK